HRDLKPANIMLGAFGETVVIDWGLARRLDIDDAAADQSDPGTTFDQELRDDRTVAGAVLGTPAYMAPEQARGEPLDARADVYALGATLRFVLSGRAPVEGETARDIISRVAAGPPPEPMRELTPDVAPDLAAIVDRAMAIDPAERYES